MDLATEVYEEGIQDLVTRYDRCLNVGRDYVENNLGSVIMIRSLCLRLQALIPPT
jgi:hypothetical protein